MSILDALRVQKANQRSVRELASLPQNEIVRMAQMGHIPADVLPVVISEKARMATEMANFKAASQMQQQGQVPTVIEQAMQANAQAEMPMQMPAQGVPQGAPQGAPQGMPQGAGVAALPTGQMFQGQNFQTGGIVAFNGEDESWVQEPGGLNVLKQEQPKPGRGPSSLAEFITQFQDLTKADRVLSPEELAFREAQKKGYYSAEDARQQQWMRMMQAGLGIMGGESPYAFSNIAKGSQEALKGYMEDVKTQQAQKLLDLKSAAELAKSARMEKLEDIKGGAALYEKHLDRQERREIAANSQLGAKAADNYVAMKIGEGDKRPREAIWNEGLNAFLKLQQEGMLARANIQAGTTTAGQQLTAGTAATGQQYGARTQAIKEWGDLKIGEPEKAEYRRLSKIDTENAKKGTPTTLAQDYKDAYIDRISNKIIQKEQSGGAPAAPAARPAERPNPVTSGAGAPKKNETRLMTSGPLAGKMAVFDGTGWKLKE